MTTYKIIRHFFDSDQRLVIKTGLTLKQAEAHCHDPETSSSTCKKPENTSRTQKYGPWFDGYAEEKS